MTLAELLDQVSETLALTATKLKEVSNRHDGIERRLAKLESRIPGGAIPGVKWPAPEPASAPGSQIIERSPVPCVNCEKCPRCGR